MGNIQSNTVDIALRVLDNYSYDIGLYHKAVKAFVTNSTEQRDLIHNKHPELWYLAHHLMYREPNYSDQSIKLTHNTLMSLLNVMTNSQLTESVLLANTSSIVAKPSVDHEFILLSIITIASISPRVKDILLSNSFLSSLIMIVPEYIRRSMIHMFKVLHYDDYLDTLISGKLRIAFIDIRVMEANTIRAIYDAWMNDTLAPIAMDDYLDAIIAGVDTFPGKIEIPDVVKRAIIIKAIQTNNYTSMIMLILPSDIKKISKVCGLYNKLDSIIKNVSFLSVVSSYNCTGDKAILRLLQDESFVDGISGEFLSAAETVDVSRIRRFINRELK